MAKPVNSNDKPICELPPTGWFCSREPGHDGPCAAYEVKQLFEDAMRYRDLCR